MADSDSQKLDAQALQSEVERLRAEVERLWSRDMAQQLRLSEARYRALIEGSSDFIYILDKDGYFTFANSESENLLGYCPEEIIGKHFSEVLHPEDFKNLGRAFHERRTGDRATRRLEVRLRSRAGDTREVELDIRHFSVSASGIYQDQTYVGTHGVARDITERKYQETKHKALQVVRETMWNMVRASDIERVIASVETSLRTMGISFSEFGVYAMDMDEPPILSLYGSHGVESIALQDEWIITDTEQFASTIAGIWRRGNLTYCRDLASEATDHDQERLSELFGPTRAIADIPFSHGVLAIASSHPAAFTTRDLTFFSELAEVLSEAFHRTGDLQELTLSEKRYRTLVETPNLVVILMDTQNNFLYVSPQIEAWLGYAPQDFYSDPAIFDRIVHPEDLDNIRTFLTSGESPVLRDLEFRWCDQSSGQFRWASGSLFPIYENPTDEQLNRVSMVQVVIQDITERKQVEEFVRDSLEEKEVLLREIHHRVKNNLQIVSSLLHLQASGLQDERVQEIFNDSQNRINSMALIHEELYNTGDLARIDFADYARTLIENLFDSYGLNTHHISLDIQVDALPLNLDRAIPMGLIINELVSNSLKYAFPDAHPGRIAIALQASGADRFTLRVSDDGGGLPEDVDIHHPTSLGLKLVLTLANQIGGKIELDRSRGTSFTITRA